MSRYTWRIPTDMRAPAKWDIYLNNTMDQSATGAGCVTSGSYQAGLGTVYMQNNICIGASMGGVNVATLNASNNRSMSTTEATNYGFIPANKLSPSSSIRPSSGAGAQSYLSLFGGSCESLQDTSGAPWLGRILYCTGCDLGSRCIHVRRSVIFIVIEAESTY